MRYSEILLVTAVSAVLIIDCSKHTSPIGPNDSEPKLITNLHKCDSVNTKGRVFIKYDGLGDGQSKVVRHRKGQDIVPAGIRNLSVADTITVHSDEEKIEVRDMRNMSIINSDRFGNSKEIKCKPARIYTFRVTMVVIDRPGFNEYRLYREVDTPRIFQSPRHLTFGPLPYYKLPYYKKEFVISILPETD